MNKPLTTHVLLLWSLLFLGCGVEAGSEADNKEIIRHWIEQLDARNVAIYDELLAEGAVVHFPGGVTLTREEAIEGEEAWYTAFPDTHHTIEDLVAEGDKVVLRHHAKGTHRAEFQGIPPSGREVTMSVMLIYRLAEGKIVEVWAEADLTGFVRLLAEP